MDDRDPITSQKTEPTLGDAVETPQAPAAALHELHLEGDFKPSWLEQPESVPFWGKRMLAFGAAAAALALLAAGGFWFSGEQKSQKALEVLAESSRNADLPAVVAPVPAPSPPPPAVVAPVESTIPPLVTLPPEEVGQPAPVVKAAAKPAVKPAIKPAVKLAARPAVKPPLKLAKAVVRKAPPAKKALARNAKVSKLAKATLKKPVVKVAARQRTRTLSPAGAPRKPKAVALRAKAPPPKRLCKRGDLARDCRFN